MSYLNDKQRSPIAGFKGPTSKGKEGEKGERRGAYGEGKEREGIKGKVEGGGGRHSLVCP